jgi:hypothetical protein
MFFPGVKIQSITLIFLLIPTLQAFADLQSAFEEIHKQKLSAEQKIQPLNQESEEIQKLKMTAQEELKRNEEKLKEIQNKKDSVFAEIRTVISFEDIVEALAVGKKPQNIGECEVRLGKEKNELYITQKSESIRILFADVGTPQQPFLRVFNKNSQEFSQIQQPDYNPKDLNKKTGPMKAEIILTRAETPNNSSPSAFKIVHAKFRGESIGDGFLKLSSSHNQKGLTCLSLDGENLF